MGKQISASFGGGGGGAGVGVRSHPQIVLPQLHVVHGGPERSGDGRIPSLHLG